MLYAGARLVIASGRVFLEAAPDGLDPERDRPHARRASGRRRGPRPARVGGHVGFPALSAHVVVGAGRDCHELRRALQQELAERFGLRHTTLQVDHEAAPQAPLRIEPYAAATPASPSASRQPE